MLEILEKGMPFAPPAPEGGDLYPQIESFAAKRLGPEIADRVQAYILVCFLAGPARAPRPRHSQRL